MKWGLNCNGNGEKRNLLILEIERTNRRKFVDGMKKILERFKINLN